MCNSYLAAVMSSLVTDKAVSVKRTLMRNHIDLSASVISTTAFKINEILKIFNLHFSSVHRQIF